MKRPILLSALLMQGTAATRRLKVRRITLPLIALLFQVAAAQACDSCGTAINGSTIPSFSSLKVTGGNVWTVVSGVPKLNGTTAGTITSVNTLLWFNGNVYADTSAPQWYQWSGTTWNTVTADPRVTSTPIGKLGTTTPNSSLVDASNNVWAANSDGACFMNGTSECSSHISQMLYMNATIYSQLTGGGWQKWGGTSWSSMAKDPRYSFQLGMNFSQYDCGQPWQFAAGSIRINSNYYSFWQGQKMYSIRLPFEWERLQPTLGGALDTTSGSNGTGFVGDLEAEVNAAAAHGQTVLIDLHNYASYTPVTNGACTIASGSGDPTSCKNYGCGCYSIDGTHLSTTNYADVWKKLATIFGATNMDGSRVYPNIYGYDIMNEPKHGTAAQLKPYIQAVINAIRTVDTDTPIFVEGECFSTTNGFQSCNGTGTLDALTDSSNKIVFSGHNYANQDSQSFQTYNSNDTPQTMVNNYTGSSTQFANWCKTQVTNGVAIGCHIGEGGVSQGSDGGGTNGQSLLTMMDNAVTQYQTDNFPFHYWEGGPCGAPSSDTSTATVSGSPPSLTGAPQWTGEGTVNGLKTYVPGP